MSPNVESCFALLPDSATNNSVSAEPDTITRRHWCSRHSLSLLLSLHKFQADSFGVSLTRRIVASRNIIKKNFILGMRWKNGRTQEPKFCILYRVAQKVSHYH